MEFLPTTLGTRPRLAIEVRAEGVVAARAEDAAALLTAVARADVAAGAVSPGLKAGNIADRAAVVAAIQAALDEVVGKSSDRGAGRDVTLIVPDAAVRVLLLDFDQLPSKIAEALPVVRFRLKKLLPFDADTAAVSYQVMASERGSVRVLAIAIPKDVLNEYEAAVTAAGYQPGAVLPSTLAALAGLDVAEVPALVVNAGLGGVTTAIVKSGALLLHRSLDLSANLEEIAVETPVVEESAAPDKSWVGQLPDGHEGYDRFDAEASMQASVVMTAEARELAAAASLQTESREVVQAVSVAAAYFEDTLQVLPETLLTAGTMGAERLAGLMAANGLEGLRVQEMVDVAVLEAGAATARVPRSWLAGVRGALKN
jgi:type IV pilus assembly protein PilM